MKKLISILVAMLMVISTMSAFAAVSVDPGASLDYLNTFAGIADYSVTSNADKNPSSPGNVGLNKDHPVNAVMSGEQLTVTRPATRYTGVENKLTGLTYLYFTGASTGITDDVLAVGFDFKLSGITSNTSNNVLDMNFGGSGTKFEDRIQAYIDRGEWFVHTDGKAYAYTKNEDGSIVYDDNGNPVPNGKAKASKTGWRFYAEGSARAGIKTKKENDEFILGENGQPAIFCGNAKLEQDAFYTFKMYVDQNNKTFYVVIIDSNGNVIDTGIKGKVQNACDNINKLDIQLMAGLNYEASVTYDNMFYDALDFAVLAPPSFEPNEEGTVAFSAAIPDNMVNPAVYINDTFVENVTLVPHKTDYVITSVLPEGTVLGDVKLEIRGTLDGKAVSTSATTKYNRSVERNIAISMNKTPTTGDDGIAYYGPADTRTKDFKAEIGGLYEIGTKFRRSNDDFVIRLKSDVITVSSGSLAIGALLGTNTDAWNRINLLGLGIKADDYNWHDISFLFDFRGNAMISEQPYRIAVDGKVVKTGTFHMDPRSTVNGFDQIGIHGVEYQMPYFKELLEVGVNGVAVNYENGTSATYENEPILSVGAKNITFELNVPFDNTNAFSFVDANGNAVDGVTLSISGNNLVVTPAEGVTIPTGSYKLVVDKTATFSGGSVLGANIEAKVELEAPASVVVPAENSVVTDNKTDITFFAPDATKVEVFVNDEKVKTFAAPTATGYYTFNYVPTKVGKNYIDIYSYGANGIELGSSSFDWSPYNAYNEKREWGATQNVTRVEDGTYNGGKAYAITSTVRGGSPFANLTVDAGHRIGVREYDIKAGENTWVYIELGLMTAPGAGTDSGSTYPNVTNIAGTSGYAILDKNHKICGTSYKWEVGQWYHFKHVINMENMTSTVYVTHEDIGTDVMVLSTPITTSVLVNNKATAINYNKYRFILKDISTADGTPATSMTVANPYGYELKAIPVASVASKAIVAGTDSVALTLDKAYDALAASNITVTANGVAVEGATAAVDGTNITVSGLANVAAGTKLEITLDGNAVYSGAATGRTSIATVFVTDANNVCLLPIKVASETGADLTAYSKYINGSGNTLSTYFIMTEYENDEATLVKQTNFATVEVKAGKTGVVSGYLTGITKAQGCQVMLWNTDYAPLLETGKLAE